MEINQFDVLFDGGEEQDVLRLKIHMDQLIFVKIGNSTEHLCDYLGCILLGQEHATVNVLIDLTE